MAITLSDIRKNNFTERASDLDKTLPELKEKYGFEFDVHDPKVPEKFILSNKITSFDGVENGDGNAYIRIDRQATTDLGKMLRFSYPRTFFTWVGECGNLKNYIDFLVVKNYPKHLLRKQRLNKHEITQIPRERVSVPNYWALVAAGFVDKVRSDTALIKLLNDNTLPIVAYGSSVTKSLFGKSVNVSGHDPRLSKYLAIIRFVEVFVKNNKLNDKPYIENWINECRDYDCDVFEGLPFEV